MSYPVVCPACQGSGMCDGTFDDCETCDGVGEVEEDEIFRIYGARHDL